MDMHVFLHASILEGVLRRQSAQGNHFFCLDCFCRRSSSRDGYERGRYGDDKGDERPSVAMQVRLIGDWLIASRTLTAGSSLNTFLGLIADSAAAVGSSAGSDATTATCTTVGWSSEFWNRGRAVDRS